MKTVELATPLPKLDWRWVDGAAAAVNETTSDAGVFRFEPGGTAGEYAPTVRFIDRHGQVRWTYTTDGREAFLLAHGGVLYAAIYSPSATGAHVLALDGATGRVLWNAPILGLGSMMHSRYQNRVQMQRSAEQLAVYGDESGGRYLELLDPATGTRVFHARFDR